MYSAVIFAFLAISVGIGKRRRIEFVNRKCHILKETAGIIIFVLNAFFVGNAVFGNIDEILCGTLNADD